MCLGNPSGVLHFGDEEVSIAKGTLRGGPRAPLGVARGPQLAPPEGLVAPLQLSFGLWESSVEI